MTVALDLTHRASTTPTNTSIALEDRFEVLKDIGDGSFGSVVLARVRGAGSNIARRGTVVCKPPWHSKLRLMMLDCYQDDEETIRIVRTVS